MIHRFLFGLIMVLTAAAGVSAQSAATRRDFEKGVRLAARLSFEPARAAFIEAAERAARDGTPAAFRAKIRFNIGVCLYRTGRAAEAVEEFEAAIRLAGDDYERAFYALGMAEAERERWPEAEKAFRHALALDARNGETWFDLAFVYLARRDFAAARTAFEKSVRYKSTAAPFGHNNLGVLYALDGDLAAAVREFETALRLAGGRLAEAERNLEFCRTRGAYLRGAPAESTARLEFGGQR